MQTDVQLKAADGSQSLKKLLVFTGRAFGFLFRRIRKNVIQAAPNTIVRRKKGLRPVGLEKFLRLSGIQVQHLPIDTQNHSEFLNSVYPDWQEHFEHPFYKKLLELHTTWTLLGIKEDDSYLDLAGGLYTYAGRTCAREQLLNDRFVSPALRAALVARGVGLVESPAERLPLADQSVDKISCHHSFEHFRKEADTNALREIQRVLRPGGKACIIPLFVGEGYFEVVDLPWTARGDKRAERVFDPTSPFPGGRFSGGFARVYDLDALRTRVLDAIDPRVFSVTVVQLEGAHTILPDPTLPCHRTDPAVDFPYRALLIERH
jgi:SAM-dependent methyltransferase